MDSNSLTTLPHIEHSTAQQLAARGIRALPQLLHALQQQQQGQEGGSSSSRTHWQQQQQGMGRSGVSSLLSSLLGAGEAQEVLQVADRLPVVDVTWRKPHHIAAATQTDSAAAVGDSQQPEQEQDSSRWQLDVELVRHGDRGRGGSGKGAGFSGRSAAPRVYAPLFPKVKEEGWWLLVGHLPSLELLALKRVSFGGKVTVKLNFPGFTSSGSEVHTATVFLVSDCYLGLDQQYDVVLNETAAAAAARAEASLASKSTWGGTGSTAAAAESNSDGWGDDTDAACGAAAGADGGGSSALQARRARRQQMMASRQQHAAAADVASGAGRGGTADTGAAGDEDAGWEDEPACS